MDTQKLLLTEGSFQHPTGPQITYIKKLALLINHIQNQYLKNFRDIDSCSSLPGELCCTFGFIEKMSEVRDAAICHAVRWMFEGVRNTLHQILLL